MEVTLPSVAASLVKIKVSVSGMDFSVVIGSADHSMYKIGANTLPTGSPGGQNGRDGVPVTTAAAQWSWWNVQI